MKFLLYILTFSSSIFYYSIHGQFEYLDAYIPYENTSKETHPIFKRYGHLMDLRFSFKNPALQ